jgi:hypothetical protein
MVIIQNNISLKKNALRKASASFALSMTDTQQIHRRRGKVNEKRCVSPRFSKAP